MTTTTTRIAELSDAQAIRTLALVLDHDKPLPDPTWLRDLDTRAREAATEPEPDLAELTTLEPVPPGELARATLTYLTDTRPDLAPVIDRALTLPAEDTSRFDPATLAIGALVLLALQTEIELTRSDKGRWRFHFRKRPLSDATLSQLLSQLLANLLPPP